MLKLRCFLVFFAIFVPFIFLKRHYIDVKRKFLAKLFLLSFCALYPLNLSFGYEGLHENESEPMQGGYYKAKVDHIKYKKVKKSIENGVYDDHRNKDDEDQYEDKDLYDDYYQDEEAMHKLSAEDQIDDDIIEDDIKDELPKDEKEVEEEDFYRKPSIFFARENESCIDSPFCSYVGSNFNPLYISFGFIYGANFNNLESALVANYAAFQSNTVYTRDLGFVHNSVGWFLSPGIEGYVGYNRMFFIGFESKIYFGGSDFGISMASKNMEFENLTNGVNHTLSDDISLSLNSFLFASPMFKAGINFGKLDLFTAYILIGLDIGKMNLVVSDYLSNDVYDSDTTILFGMRGGFGFSINLTRAFTLFTEFTYGGFLNTNEFESKGSMVTEKVVAGGDDIGFQNIHQGDYNVSSIILTVGLKINMASILEIPHFIKYGEYYKSDSEVNKKISK